MRTALAYLIALTSVVALRGETFALGKIIDSVACGTNPAQKYALYLPSTYSDRQQWPVIFCLDPGARGRVPVERLQTAAEKYGYIVAGSLNSRNGPLSENATAVDAMIKDVCSFFAVDRRRIYTAGLSGGARVATAVGMSGVAKGVIACSAGFPTLEDGIPWKIPFAFYGAAGSEDFNYAEMIRLGDDLEARKATFHIAIFNGTHEWPPIDAMTAAVEWLELQAMKSDARGKDGAFVQQQFQLRAEALAKLSDLEWWRAMKALVADFRGLVDVTAQERAAKTLGGTREVKAALKAERTLLLREDQLVSDLMEIAVDSSAKRRAKLVNELRQKADAPEDTPERRMVRRAISGFVVGSQEAVSCDGEGDEAEATVSRLEMAVALRPSNERALFNLARVQAKKGDYAAALTALERAAAAGYRALNRIETEPAFDRLHTNPRYLAVLATLRAATAEPTPPAAARREATPMPAESSPAAHTPELVPPPPVGATDHTRPANQGEIVRLPPLRVSAALASIEVRPFYLTQQPGETATLSFLRVESIRPNTAAARAGIVAGMEITGIQGVALHGLTDPELNALMTQPAKNEITLAVREPPFRAEHVVRIQATERANVAEK